MPEFWPASARASSARATEQHPIIGVSACLEGVKSLIHQALVRRPTIDRRLGAESQARYFFSASRSRASGVGEPATMLVRRRPSCRSLERPLANT